MREKVTGEDQLSFLDFWINVELKIQVFVKSGNVWIEIHVISRQLCALLSQDGKNFVQYVESNFLFVHKGKFCNLIGRDYSHNICFRLKTGTRNFQIIGNNHIPVS